MTQTQRDIFVGLIFRYQVLKAYFRGIIFDAYCLDCRGLIFHVGALRNKSKTQRKCPAIRYTNN